jgi:hypothetical protein
MHSYSVVNEGYFPWVKQPEILATYAPLVQSLRMGSVISTLPRMFNDVQGTTLYLPNI